MLIACSMIRLWWILPIWFVLFLLFDENRLIVMWMQKIQFQFLFPIFLKIQWYRKIRIHVHAVRKIYFSIDLHKVKTNNLRLIVYVWSQITILCETPWDTLFIFFNALRRIWHNIYIYEYLVLKVRDQITFLTPQPTLKFLRFWYQ